MATEATRLKPPSGFALEPPREETNPRFSWLSPPQELAKPLLGALCVVGTVSTFVGARFFEDSTMRITSALLCGFFAQVGLETTPIGLRNRVTHFNNEWSIAIFLGITQVYINCPFNDESCEEIQKEIWIFLRAMAIVWIVGSLLSQVRRTRADELLALSSNRDPAHGIQMVEPNSTASFYAARIAEACAGSALLTFAYTRPSMNAFDLLDDMGSFLIGNGAVPLLTRFLWNQWQNAEKKYRDAQVADRTGAEEPPFGLKTMRVTAALCDILSRNFIGALFIADKIPKPALNVCYGFIGGLYGSSKFVAQQKFLALTTEDIRSLRLRRPEFGLYEKITIAVKLSLSAGVAGYLTWQMFETPLEGKVALISFGANTYISYLLTRFVDAHFCKKPTNQWLASLQFYLVKFPDFLPLAFFVIDQQMKIGDQALKKDTGLRLILAYLAWGSLGASVGNSPARFNSPIVLQEPISTPSITQFLSGQLVEQSYAGQT